MDGSTALSIYRAEKERALQERRISHAQLMAEAKEAFAKMLADAQLARKGGRPRNNPNAPPTAAAAAAKPKPVVIQAPAKKTAEVIAAPKPVKVKVVSAKAAPAKKASGKVRVAAKRAQPARGKTRPAERQESGSESAPARAARPTRRMATHAKSSKKR